MSPDRPILVVGAGIAGLTMALALAERGFSVNLFERARVLDEVGAGLQLSPNATRILDRLGVVERLRAAAVQPEAIVLRRARSLREIARVPLGAGAVARWGAPYLTVHRADLQAALVARVQREPSIRLVTGATVRDAAYHARGVTLSIDHAGAVIEAAGDLAIAADGVWSTMRGTEGPPRSAFSGLTAWRATLPRGPSGGRPDAVLSGAVVTALLHGRFHLVAYPIRAGQAVNLVAVTRGAALTPSWSVPAAKDELAAALSRAPALARLVGEAGPWTRWPLHTVDPRGPWTSPRGIALIGDAAHAMTPFAAQGAAMAIEDADVLAETLHRHRDDFPAGLSRYERERKPRVARVVRRGAFNRFVWHAAGPIALGRDAVLRLRGPDRTLADLDWLYGWRGTGSAD
nr:FAD-dependent oxidoreductase [Aquibium microcysteis]